MYVDKPESSTLQGWDHFLLARRQPTNNKPDIAFIAYFTLIATFSSIIQQLYDYIFWRDLMVQQYFYGKDHADDAEVQYQKGIFGLKLVLSYIRAYFAVSHFLLLHCFLLLCTRSVMREASAASAALYRQAISQAKMIRHIPQTNTQLRAGIFAFTVESTLVFFL